MKSFVWQGLVGFIGLGFIVLPTQVAAQIDFNRQVRPLLSDRCFACHGPDSSKRESGLRLDTFEGATAETDSGVHAIVPGDPDSSALVTRIHATDSSDRMPPDSLGRPLTETDQQILVQWIAEGAPYATHWAFAPIEEQPLPHASNFAWSSGPIDPFVQSRLEQEGLQPNGLADRSAELRRVFFALNGLPPTPEELAEYLADQSPDAFHRQVDRLLASPRYGERMALDWLDVARFADTLGYQIDGQCFVWPWRDWVIRAYNEDLPYDQFLTWQIAGDLLPDATQDQKLATLFNRLHRQTNEGGSIEQEFRQEYVSDRVHTFGTAFLGLTLECSRCHDHKYDPLPQTDYYSLCAMFSSIDECGLYPYGVSTSAAEPSMRLMESEQEAEAIRRRDQLELTRKSFAEVIESREPAFLEWLSATENSPELLPQLPEPSDYFPMDQLIEGRVPNAVAGREPGVMSGGVLESMAEGNGGSLRFDGDTVLQLDSVNGITRHDPLSVSVRLFCPDRKQRAVIMHTGPALYALASDASGFELLLEEGKLRWSCIFLWPGCCASIEMLDDFPIGRWVDVTVTYDGSSQANGLRVFLDGQPVATQVLHDHLDKSIVTEKMRLGSRPRDDRGFANGMMDELKIFRQSLSELEVAALDQQVDETDLIARTLAAARSADTESLAVARRHFLDRVDRETKESRAAVSQALKHLEDNYLHQLPLIMTMKASPNPRPVYVLQRGDYSAPDFNRPVTPSAPQAIFPFGPELSQDRLGLARWMTDPGNPLVSRVAVNRHWMQCFGEGLVVTQENFGMQGDTPSHPELLNRLSYEFMQQGWSSKWLLRQIVTSSTFRQSSVASSEQRAMDPANRLLSRGPAYRLSGEAIRDQALVASGRYVERLGGPSVKPWQPEGIWSEAGVSGGEYVPDVGAAAARRSLYTYRKRTAPPPSLLTLDAGSREVCQPRRSSTNTPLQPLVFLNDRGFFENAVELARRVSRERPDDAHAQLELAFLSLTSRFPDETEAETLHQLYTEQVEYFNGDAAAAQAICGQPNSEWAAMAIVCSTLLASDAAITVR